MVDKSFIVNAPPGTNAPEYSLDVTKDLHNIPTSGAGARNMPAENPNPPPRKKRLSLGGGNDGHGAPLFSNLEASKQKHMYDGYEDMKPKDGFVGGIYRKLVNAKHTTGATPHTK
ncbi:hypothetical protein BDD12DRAFT_803808 [Trichophaea hybrida]|nr:hypothetical protein BDD12DRAFT_803808 [Trichophaea hybrida]